MLASACVGVSTSVPTKKKSCCSSMWQMSWADIGSKLIPGEHRNYHHFFFLFLYRNSHFSTHSITLVLIHSCLGSSASYVELKGFLEESVVMCGFDHPHVLGLIGISLDPSNSPHLLLPFMKNGDLRTYLKNKRDADGIIYISEYPQVRIFK